MPVVTLKITRWMCQNLNIALPASGEICVSVPDGEPILRMVGRLATENGGFWKTILEEIGASILVVLNGSVVSPYDRPEVILKEGDELLFLPMFDGG